MTFGHVEKYRDNSFWFRGRIHGCCVVLVRMGKTQICANFALMYFEKGQIFKILFV